MNNSKKSVYLNIILSLMPPSIRESLLDDTEFCSRYKIKTEAIISFAGQGPSFKRMELYDAVRQFFSNQMPVEIIDMKKQQWRLMVTDDENKCYRFELVKGEETILIPNLAGLSPNKNERIINFNKLIYDVNLDKNNEKKWLEIFSKRSLDDDEMDTFQKQIEDTPVIQMNRIKNQIDGRNLAISALVPNSHIYYERLVGIYDGSNTINDYAKGNGRTFLNNLRQWRPYEGFLYSLFLSSHSSLTDEIVVEQLDSQSLLKAFDFLDKNGDIVSQLGAIEIGLRILSERPEIESTLIQLIEKIESDDPTDENSQFQLLPALFILVDGELSRRQLFKEEPPFYRRLAALSQAALIHHLFIGSEIDISSFIKWAFKSRSEQYYLQSLTDMRLEPRWNPDLIHASQLKAEFLGRIIISAEKNEINIRDKKIYDSILGIKSKTQITLNYFIPGPLEGHEVAEIPQSIELSNLIAERLSQENLDAPSLMPVINSALIYGVNNDQLELILKKIMASGYRFTNIKDRAEFVSVLDGLANVAAISRCHALADELRIVVRRYNREGKYSLSAIENMKICLIAASAIRDFKTWNKFVGDWITELAFSDFKNGEEENLYSYLRSLFRIVPELWITCGRAEAALKSILSKRKSFDYL